MSAEPLLELLTGYLAGEVALETAAAALVRAYHEQGWGLYLDPAELPPEQRARAEALIARYRALTGAPLTGLVWLRVPSNDC
jgi:hypothetical protein